jgi:hypothetical protein
MNRNERSLSSYQMYGPTKPPLRLGPLAEEGEAGLVAAARLRAAPVMKQREEGVGRLAAPGPVHVVHDDRRRLVLAAVGEVPDQRHQREV